MKKRLEGNWTCYRRGFREHLKKMTGNEVKLWNFYLLSVDYHSWICGFPTAYLAKALGGSEHTWVKAKRGLAEKGYIEKLGQTNIRIPKFKKWEKQAKAEISAPLLAKIEALEKRLNTAESAVNTAESAVNTAETAPLIRKRDKQTKAGGKDLFVKNETLRKLNRYLTERNQGKDMTNYSINYLKKWGERAVSKGLDALNRAANPTLALFHSVVKANR
jgi:hypothetical protein